MRNQKNPQTREELNYLVHLAQNGSIEARNTIIERNIGLVLSCAGKMSWQSPDGIEDVFQEGVLGLMRAIATYEPKRNLAFSTYAMWWIKQRIMRHWADTRNLIRVPVWAQDIRRQYKKLRVTYPEMSNAEICEMIARIRDYTLKAIKEVVELKFHMESFYKVNEETNEEYEIASSEDTDLTALNNLDLDYLLCHLPFREYRFIKYRLDGMTLSAIGEHEGISRERVRQICDKAITSMRFIANVRKPV